jgi:hypothetical protein
MAFHVTKKNALGVILICCTGLCMAQNHSARVKPKVETLRTITGVVADETGFPAISAKVGICGSGVCTYTDTVVNSASTPPQALYWFLIILDITLQNKKLQPKIPIRLRWNLTPMKLLLFLAIR